MTALKKYVKQKYVWGAIGKKNKLCLKKVDPDPGHPPKHVKKGLTLRPLFKFLIVRQGCSASQSLVKVIKVLCEKARLTNHIFLIA